MEVLSNGQKKVLKDQDPAKIFMVYIYSKKEGYKADKSKWITMLYKGMNSSQPEIAYTLPKSAEVSNTTKDSELEDTLMPTYEIISEKISEAPSKAQIVQYVLYTGDNYTETALRATMCSR